MEKNRQYHWSKLRIITQADGCALESINFLNQFCRLAVHINNMGNNKGTKCRKKLISPGDFGL